MYKYSSLFLLSSVIFASAVRRLSRNTVGIPCSPTEAEGTNASFAQRVRLPFYPGQPTNTAIDANVQRPATPIRCTASRAADVIRGTQVQHSRRNHHEKELHSPRTKPSALLHRVFLSTTRAFASKLSRFCFCVLPSFSSSVKQTGFAVFLPCIGKS